MRLTGLFGLLLLGMSACDDTGSGLRVVDPPEPAVIQSVSPLSQMALGARVQIGNANADRLRVRFKSLDGDDTGATPWQPAVVTSILVLGLRSSTTYSLWIESERPGETVDGPVTEYTTAPLPPGLADVQMQLEGLPS